MRRYLWESPLSPDKRLYRSVHGCDSHNSKMLGGNGSPLHYSCLETPMDRGAWWAAVHGVTMSQTRLSDFTFTFHFHALEKEMATHSSVLAWRIPGTGEPGGLPSMGFHRVGHDWSDLAAAAAHMTLYANFRNINNLYWKTGPSNFLFCTSRFDAENREGMFRVKWIEGTW